MMTPALALAAIVCARTVTLEQAEQAAETRAPTVREARAEAAAGQARTEVARAPALPQVRIDGLYERTTGNRRQRPGRTTEVNNSWTTYNWFDGQATASQLLWDFGQTVNRWRAAEARAVALNDTARASVLEALSTVRGAYFNARAAKELIVVAKTTLANQERHLVQITGFVGAGTRPDIDLAQARVGTANARVAMIRAETGYEVARAELNQAMGQAGDIDYDVAEQTLPPIPGETGPVGPLIDEAIKARPDLASLDAEVRAQELGARAARGGYWPRLDLIAGAADSGIQFEKEIRRDNFNQPVPYGGMAWNVWGGLQLKWDVFQGLQTRGQVREADALIQSVRARRDGLVNEVWVAVQRASAAVRAAHESLVAAEEALVAANQRLRLADGRYSAGVGSIIELADAELAAANAGAQRVTAEFTLSTARADLLLALGRR